MISVPRLRRLALALAAAVVLAACASVDTSSDPNARYVRAGPFPAPAELRAPVEFWKKVYSTWSLGQYALHDDRYLDLVYEVVDLPGGAREGLSDSDRQLLRERKAALEARLRELERKTVAGESLDDGEKKLRARIVASSAGAAGITGSADRLRAQRGIRERFKRGVEISGRYDSRFRGIFREAGVPEDLAYLPHVESSFQANARSSVGAAGIWQFMPSTARNYMVLHPATDERLDPVTAARGASRYLADAYQRLGDWALAITSYNHGVGGMARARSQYGSDFGRIVREYDGPSFGFASRNFYAQFLAAREIAGEPLVYFKEGLVMLKPLEGEQLQLDRPTSASHLASYYGTSLDRLETLNPAWSSAAVGGRAMLPGGARIWVPNGTLAMLAASGRPTTPPELIAMADTPPRVVTTRKRSSTRVR